MENKNLTGDFFDRCRINKSMKEKEERIKSIIKELKANNLQPVELLGKLEIEISKFIALTKVMKWSSSEAEKDLKKE